MLLLLPAIEWLLQGGCRASFPLMDTLLHRRLVRLRGVVGRGVGDVGLPAAFARDGDEVGQVFVGPVGFFSFEAGGGPVVLASPMPGAWHQPLAPGP